MASTVNVIGNDILDSPYEAIQFQDVGGYTVDGVTIVGNTVHNVGTFVVQEQAPARRTFSARARPGSATLGYTTAAADSSLCGTRR